MPDFVVWPHPALTTKAVARPVDASLIAVGDALLDAAAKAQAYGLAAAHIGAVEPVVVISVADDPAIRDFRILFNPQIASMSDQQATGPEGSVSMPGIEAPILRATSAMVAFDDADGQRQTLNLKGFSARVAQHEIEQVNGTFFLTRLSRLKRETAIRKFEKSRRG